MSHRLTISLILLILSMGCASDGGDPLDPGGTPEDLSDAALVTDHGVPLTRIGVTGLDGDSADYQVELVDADGTVRSGAPMLEDVDGAFQFPVPFHPDDPAEGGLTQVRITKGEATSELFPFTVDPLPAATVGMSGVVDKMRSNLELRAGLLNTSVAELASADWADLAPAHVPLKAVWGMLDDPDNENRLSELAAGRAPRLGQGALDVDLLDRVVDLVGAPAFMDVENQFMSELGEPPQKTIVDIGSAEQLDWYMGLARSSQFRLEEGSAVHQLNSDLGLVMAGVGIIPHPAAQLTAAGVGALQYAYNTARQAMANLLPSSFQTMEFQISHEFFNEDSVAIGEWSNVDVWAVSQGWNADQAMVDGLLTLASFGRAHGDWMNRFEDITGTAWAENVRNFIVDNVLRMLNALGQNGIVEFDPETFGPVDVTGDPWSKGVVLTDKIRIIADKMYQPNAVGTDQLEVRTGDGLFGGASIELSKPVEVRGIRVEVTPQITQLENAGEVVTVQATVFNADNKGLQWIIAPATWEIAPDGVGTGTEIGSIKTPLNEDLYNFSVSAKSTSNTGLRANATNEISGSGEIRLDEKMIVIDPGYECIGNGQELTFTAEVTGLEDTRVTWSKADGYGSIDATTGVYRALSEGSGEATIVATSVEDPELWAWASVSFGACNCWWGAKVTGAGIWTCGGDQSAFIRSEPEGNPEFSIISFLFANPDGPGGDPKEDGISFSVAYAGPNTYPFVGDKGTYRINGAWFSGGTTYTASQVEDDPQNPGPVLELTITEHTATAIQGVIRGGMMWEDQIGLRHFVTVYVEFRAAEAFNQSSCFE